MATGFLLLGLGESTPAYLYFAAAVSYLVGCQGVTGRINVPLNNALEDSTSTDRPRRWPEFSPRWRRWNTVRIACGGIALILCGLGRYVWGG